MSIMILPICVLLPILISLSAAQLRMNVNTCCPLTSVHMTSQSDVIYEHYTSFQVGHDQDGPTHLAFHKHKIGRSYGIWFPGSKRQMPIMTDLDDGSKGERSYEAGYNNRVKSDQSSHYLLTNDKKCVTGWDRITSVNNYWRKDSADKHYPEFSGVRFVKIPVTFNNVLYSVIGSAWGLVSRPIIYYRFGGKPPFGRVYIHGMSDRSSHYDLFHVKCVESVKKLLNPEIVKMNTNNVNIAELFAKKSSNVQFYSSERIENQSPVELTHTFEKTEENESEIQDTTNSSLRNIFRLDAGGKAGFSFLGFSIGGSADRQKYEESETSKSKTIKTKRKDTIKISRTIKVPPYMWIQLYATMDKIDNARVPYEATYKIFAKSSLTNKEIQGMLRGVGYDGQFDTNSDDDLLIKTNGYMDVKAGNNIKIVVIGGHLKKPTDARAKRSTKSSPFCYVIPCQPELNSTIGKFVIRLIALCRL